MIFKPLLFQRLIQKYLRQNRIRSIIFFALIWTFSYGSLFAGDVRRTHRFIRPLAMGDTFTAVADGYETAAYNPAGLIRDKTEWSTYVPFLWTAYNDLVRQGIEGSLDLFDSEDQSSYSNLPGKRIYLEEQFGLPVGPFLYFPESGIFYGQSAAIWLEFVFPKATVIPMVHLEMISQGVVEYAMAHELFMPGLSLGWNLKVIKRIGVIADISLLRISNLEASDLEEEYSPDPPGIKLTGDFGALYRIPDHPLNLRFGVSALDIGGIDYGSAGNVKQFNSLGAAMTQEFSDVSLTYSADFQDYTFSYFNDNDIRRRFSLGFEAGGGQTDENWNAVSFQLGLRELLYPSVGFNVKVGIFEFSSAQWTENFGTAKNPILDKRYMFLISFIM